MPNVHQVTVGKTVDTNTVRWQVTFSEVAEVPLFAVVKSTLWCGGAPYTPVVRGPLLSPFHIVSLCLSRPWDVDLFFSPFHTVSLCLSRPWYVDLFFSALSFPPLSIVSRCLLRSCYVNGRTGYVWTARYAVPSMCC